jgi:hypothetical protein
LIQSHTPSAFAFAGITGCFVEADGCETALGPVGLCAQPPNIEAADTSMNSRVVRDMGRSGFGKPYRYRWRTFHADIAGGTLICHGAAG